MRSRNTPLESVNESYLMHSHDLSERTRTGYGEALAHWVAWLRRNGYEGVLRDMDPNVVNQYIAELRRRSIWVARLAAATLKAFASWLARSGILHDRGRSVLAEVRTPKVPQNVRQPLTPAEVERVLKAAGESRYPERDYALVLLALDTGLRRNELCMLKLSDVSLRELTVTIRGATSKSNATHEAALGHEAARALDRYIQDFREESDRLPNGTDRLWLGSDGLPLTAGGMGLIFTRIRQRSGVRTFKAHVCRHTWATEFRKRGSGDLLDLKAQGGWHDDKMLQRYSHALPLAERRRGPSPMDALLKDRRGGGVRPSFRQSGDLRVIGASA